MQWTATLHGDTDDNDPEAGAAAEQKVADALGEIAGGLAAAGHTGIGATFHGGYVGTINLAQPGAPIDAGPVTAAPADPVAQLGPGEIDRADVAAAAGVEPGTPVPLAPGQALAPEEPDASPTGNGDAQQPPGDAQSA
jgi:hypothetical protein